MKKDEKARGEEGRAGNSEEEKQKNGYIFLLFLGSAVLNCFFFAGKKRVQISLRDCIKKIMQLLYSSKK